MAYDEALADEVRELLAGHRPVEKRMFGGLALLADGHLAVAATREGLMVRVDPSEAERLLDEPGTGPMPMGDRGPVRGWLLVDAGALDDADALRAWVARGVKTVGGLPPR